MFDERFHLKIFKISVMDKMPIGTAELQADLTDSLVQNCYDHAVHNNNTQSDRCCRDIRRDEKNKQ